MLPHVARIVELFAAHLAGERPLPGVNAPMDDKILAIGVALGADGANVPLLRGAGEEKLAVVDIHMLPQVVGIMELFATHFTGERALPGVDAPVDGQVLGTRVTLEADCAHLPLLRALEGGVKVQLLSLLLEALTGNLERKSLPS
jgi:hypothetical protein